MNTGEVIALIKAFGGGGGSSGGGVLVVHRNVDTLDKTWQQIHDALLSGGAVLVWPDDKNVHAIFSAGYIELGGGTYLIEAGTSSFVTAEADGYPVVEGDD